ncbi:hypothetical protein BH582_24540 [Vibrio sp. 10N.222.47.A9]|uniref:hypothetical protein n=1 Tax=Vibrio sp. 10N.222.47.A9 TaxID=1903178 RepID=UPI000978532F|nr:hypothetical protein [Vibrio sp. 10N.222.47.A9]OMO22523.1 hypothetical protein BH582_24540 [Vibrio sp. 10N.222.47.A9]
MAYRSRSTLINLLSELYDLMGDFWIVGMVLSLIFTVITALAINWAFNTTVNDNGNVITQLLAPIYFFRWLTVLGPGIPMIMFSMKTYQAWSKLI